MPGQGEALGGEEGRRVLRNFQELAQPLMPLTAESKALLRTEYLRMYAEAGGFVFVCPVFLHL
jgi:hypothetical protein